MQNNTYIPVSRPSLPEINKYYKNIQRIWDNHMLSNFYIFALEMENIIKKYINNPNVVLVSNADTGMIISFSLLDIKPGDEVIVPSFTFNSTTNALLWNNLKPVFSDIDKDSLCINLKDAESKITRKTKAILATHTFGNPCNVDELRKIAEKNNLFLIFDSASAYGSVYKGIKIGNLGDIEVFSFSGTKVVTSAEGGAIVFSNHKYIEGAMKARNYGFINDYNTEFIGLNGKISEFNAALGCLTLPDIDKKVTLRNHIAEKYQQLLNGIADISFQKIDKESVSSYNNFAILTNKRDGLSEYLNNRGIQTKKYFLPIHSMKLYSTNIYRSLKVTDSIARRCLCLPIFNDISDQEILRVTDTIKKFYE